MADEKLPNSDGIAPGAPGPLPIPRFSQDVIYANAPPSTGRSEAVVAGSPAPAPPPPPPPAPKTALPHRSQFNLFICWLAGVFIIIGLGWGFIGFGAFIDRRFHLHIYLEVFAAVISFVSLYTLERNLWLSRFMGLRLGPRSSQLTETLFFFFFGIAGLLLRSSDAPAATASRHHENDGTREIVETVVFVVVLVLMLKTFLVEAFVIPTGSMADTLLGYHRDYTCDKCRYRFVVNCSTEAEPIPGQRQPDKIIGGRCPNCGFNHVNPQMIRNDR